MFDFSRNLKKKNTFKCTCSVFKSEIVDDRINCDVLQHVNEKYDLFQTLLKSSKYRK